MQDPTLVLENISKIFPGQVALDGIDLALHPGEVHALVGQNGCGKSTLIKIMAGYHTPEPGARGRFGDQEFEFGSPAAAEQIGMRFIHQDLGLVGNLDTIDNLALGRGYRSPKYWINFHREAADARALLKRFGVEFDVRRPVSQLTAAEKSFVAIARALDGFRQTDAHVLVLDEPTASLPRNEVHQLFASIRRVRDVGGAVLYVSHRLDEVFEIADRVTVLRDGRKVTTAPIGELTQSRLVELIVGRPLGELYPAEHHTRADVALSVHGLTGQIARGVSFSVHRGEIVGLSGIMGSGREETPYLLFGARPWAGGMIKIQGQSFTSIRPHEALEAGLALVPADRKAQSAIPEFNVRENLTLPRLEVRSPFRWLGIRTERRTVGAWLQRLQVNPLAPEINFSSLSGGNQQKVVLAKWLRAKPNIIVLDEPVQGVDIGAKAAIYRILARTADEGVAIVMSSGEVEDMANVCDRVIVFHDGEIVAELQGESLTAENIVQQSLAAAGTVAQAF